MQHPAVEDEHELLRGRGTLVGQGVAAVPLALLTDPFLLAPKLAIAGYLLLTRNGDWR